MHFSVESGNCNLIKTVSFFFNGFIYWSILFLSPRRAERDEFPSHSLAASTMHFNSLDPLPNSRLKAEKKSAISGKLRSGIFPFTVTMKSYFLLALCNHYDFVLSAFCLSLLGHSR